MFCSTRARARLAAFFSTHARGGKQPAVKAPLRGGGGNGGSAARGPPPAGGARGAAPGGGAAGAPAAAAARAAPAASSSDVVMTLRGVGKTLQGGRALFRDVNLSFARGAKIGVLGQNGAGKSTLLKILGGLDTEFEGAVWREEGLRVGYLAQEPALAAGRTVHDTIMEGLAGQTALLARFEALSAAMGEPGADLDALLGEQAEVQARIEAEDCWTLAHVARQAKEALRVPPDGAAVDSLSGGERRRVALCRLLLERPGVLLLDEPTNHLDATSVAWLEHFLAGYKGTVLAVTHDRYFLDNVAGWILEVDRGAAVGYAGNYSVWLEKKAARSEEEKRADRKRARAMDEELAWIRQGARARQAKSKARVARYEAAAAGAAEERAQARLLSGAMVIPPAPRLGDVVVEAEGLARNRPDGSALFSGVTFSVPPGAVVGVVGANGAGKTTLLRTLMGDAGFEAHAGSVRFGATVQVGFVSQSRAELAPNSRVVDAVMGGEDSVEFGPTYRMPAGAYLAQFNLVGEQQMKLVRNLSGGERNRVHLARTLKRGVNLLLLDEPTNDLDVDTLRSLEEALAEWGGSAIVVSHDRYFLDRVCTHMLVFHAGGRTQFIEGGFSEYLALLKSLGKRAVEQGMYVLPGAGTEDLFAAGAGFVPPPA